MTSANFGFLNAHCMLTVADLQHERVNNKIRHSCYKNLYLSYYINNTSVGIVTRKWTGSTGNWGLIPKEHTNFSLLLFIQTNSQAYPAS